MTIIINNGVRTFHLDDTDTFIEYLLLRNMHFTVSSRLSTRFFSLY